MEGGSLEDVFCLFGFWVVFFFVCVEAPGTELRASYMEAELKLGNSEGSICHYLREHLHPPSVHVDADGSQVRNLDSKFPNAY